MSRPYKPNGEILEHEFLPEGLRRIAAVIEYRGTDYHGFQIQRHDTQTIQEHLHRAFSVVACEPISLVCAGRTDAGVHATNQLIHFDTQAERPQKAWVKGVNNELPVDIRVRWAKQVAPQFHARFSAVHRRYRYLITDQDVKPALMQDQITWSRFELDIELMQAGANELLGEHDFTSFRAAQCQARNAIRDIQQIRFYRLSTGFIVMEIQANAFLYHMVRNIVGVLLLVGQGRKPVNWVAEVLKAKDRCAAAMTAPANGLYLVRAQYPEALEIPQLALGPHLIPDELGGK